MATLLDHIRRSPHRNRLEKHIAAALPVLASPVLDIGSRNRRYDHLLRQPPTAIDIVENKEAGILYGDVMALSFPDGSFQSVVCFEVLEYVSEPQKAIDEMYRVLKKDGTVVLSVPFMFRVHEDKLRYTAPYLRALFARFDIVSFDVVGGSYTVALTILWGKIKKISFAPARYLLTTLFLPLLVFLRTPGRPSEQYASGYIIVAKKKA